MTNLEYALKHINIVEFKNAKVVPNIKMNKLEGEVYIDASLIKAFANILLKNNKNK